MCPDFWSANNKPSVFGRASWLETVVPVGVLNFRFGSKADIEGHPTDVCFTSESGQSERVSVIDYQWTFGT
jgi:hypothetical protein